MTMKTTAHLVRTKRPIGLRESAAIVAAGTEHGVTVAISVAGRDATTVIGILGLAVNDDTLVVVKLTGDEDRCRSAFKQVLDQLTLTT